MFFILVITLFYFHVLTFFSTEHVRQDTMFPNSKRSLKVPYRLSANQELSFVPHSLHTNLSCY